VAHAGIDGISLCIDGAPGCTFVRACLSPVPDARVSFRFLGTLDHLDHPEKTQTQATQCWEFA